MKRTLKLRIEVPDILVVHPVIPGLPWRATPDDALKFEFRERGIDGTITLNVSYGEDWDAPFPDACGELVVVIQGQCDDGAPEEDFLLVARWLTHAYVNQFLTYVRVWLGQHWVGSIPISKWQLMYFVHQTKARWVGPDGEEDVFADRVFAEMLPPALNFDHKWWPLYRTERQSAVTLLQEMFEWAPDQELLASAKQHFVTSDYGVAAVEAVSALEVGLERFLTKRYRARRIAKKYKDVSAQVGVSMLVKLLLPAELSEEELGRCRGLINRCDKLRRVRNKVVHEGAMPDQGEVNHIRRGIEAAEELLDFVEGLDR